MSNNIFAVFLMACVLISSGCLDIGDENQEIVDDDKQEPVGETNMTSLEKRIIDLEAKILEYEQPKVYFQEFGGDDVSFTDGSVNLADDGNLFCWYYEFRNENMCNLAGVSYDVNGIIVEFYWESSKSGKLIPTYSNYGNNDTGIVYTYGTHGAFLNVCDTNVIDPSHGYQIITLTVYDNDGNSASASYDLNYDLVCTVEEPDNTCVSDSGCPPGTICQGGVCMEYNLNVCEDGEESEESGMIRTCVNGDWSNDEPIICPQDEKVTNHTCEPCPEGSVNGEGDDASGSDTMCTNEPPIIWSFTIVPKIITDETETFATNLDAEDPEQSSLSVSAELYHNGQLVDSKSSEMFVNFIFDLSEYDVVTGDELSVTITVMDPSGQGATATHTVIIEEESE